MKMEYKLLGNGTGIILTRQPEIVNDELIITFSGSPSGATAIVEINGDSHYYTLHDETCAIPCAKLNGAVKITVELLDGSAKPKKWLCEGLRVTEAAVKEESVKYIAPAEEPERSGEGEENEG